MLNNNVKNQVEFAKLEALASNPVVESLQKWNLVPGSSSTTSFCNDNGNYIPFIPGFLGNMDEFIVAKAIEVIKGYVSGPLMFAIKDNFGSSYLRDNELVFEETQRELINLHIHTFCKLNGSSFELISSKLV